jgi:hypothetical protein
MTALRRQRSFLTQNRSLNFHRWLAALDLQVQLEADFIPRSQDPYEHSPTEAQRLPSEVRSYAANPSQCSYFLGLSSSRTSTSRVFRWTAISRLEPTFQLEPDLRNERAEDDNRPPVLIAQAQSYSGMFLKFVPYTPAIRVGGMPTIETMVKTLNTSF